MAPTYQSQASVGQASAMIAFSKVDHPMVALFEAIENELDAHATWIIVVLGPNYIWVLGNGRGLTLMTERDLRRLAEFRNQPAGQPPTITLDDFMHGTSEVSRHSLQWMMEVAAFSHKIVDRDENTVGIRAIGKEAYRAAGNTTIWETRPHPELALAYFGPGKQAENPPKLS